MYDTHFNSRLYQNRSQLNIISTAMFCTYPGICNFCLFHAYRNITCNEQVFRVSSTNFEKHFLEN